MYHPQIKISALDVFFYKIIHFDTAINRQLDWSNQVPNKDILTSKGNFERVCQIDPLVFWPNMTHGWNILSALLFTLFNNFFE